MNTSIRTSLLLISGILVLYTLGLGQTVRNVPTPYATITAAITAANNGDTIIVAAGTYNENLTINKALTFKGANADIPWGSPGRGAESTVQDLTQSDLPVFTVNSDNVTIDGFEIIDPWTNNAIYNGASGHSFLNVSFNYIHDIGSLRGSGNIYAFHYMVGNSVTTTNVNVSDNYINNVANATTALGNSSGIWFGQSTSTGILNNVTIERNIVTNVKAAVSTKEVLGIYIGTGWNSTGYLQSPVIRYNVIKSLVGRYAHAIGLEGNTPGAIVMYNVVDSISSPYTPPDAEAVNISTNNASATVTIKYNNFTNVLYNVVNATAGLVNAAGNWWGSTAAPSPLGSVTYSPWLGIGTDAAPLSIGFQPVSPMTWYANISATLQSAINAVAAGDIIQAAAGTFAENISLNKKITLAGAGSSVSGTIISPASGNGINVSVGGTGASDRLVVRDIRITCPGYGINMMNAVSYVTVDDVVQTNGVEGFEFDPGGGPPAFVFTDMLINNSSFLNNSGMGFRLGRYSSIIGLTITGSHFDGNNRGFYNNMDPGGVSTVLTQVNISNTTFNNNANRGMNVEKLDHAIFANITVQGNGTPNLNNYESGIDINLKYGSYQNITFNNATITNNGVANTTNSCGITVKGRNDGSYSSNPGTLSGLHFIGGTFGAPNAATPAISIGNSVSNLDFSGGVTITGSGIGLSVWTDPGSPAVDLGNTSFAGSLAYDIVDGSAMNVTATGATFIGAANNFAIEDKVYHTMDNAAVGLVTWVANNFYVTPNSGSIQRGINAATAGNTVNVAAGTFAENVTIDRQLTLDGAGSTTSGTVITPASGDGITISASGASSSSRVQLKNLRVSGAPSNGITITAPNASYLTFDNVASVSNGSHGVNTNPPPGSANFVDFVINNCSFSSNASVGFRFASYTGINGLTITNSHMDGNTEGLYSEAGSYLNPIITNVTVSGTTFNTNSLKGIYMENLDHATFTNITVANSGTSTTNSAGVDINDKYHSFQNITFTNAIITNCGTGDAVNGAGITIKARDDGTSYSPHPATLTNVQLTGCTITGCQEGIRFGEPAKNNAGPTNVIVSGCTISGDHLKGLRNESQSVTDARHNWWGSASGPFHATLNSGGTGDTVTDRVTFDPWTGKATPVSVTSDSVNHVYDVTNTTVDLKFTSLPPGTSAAVSVQEVPSSWVGPPALPTTVGTVPPLYLVFGATGLTNGTFTCTVTIDVSGISGFSSSTEVMYYSTISNSWVGVSGTYDGVAHTFTFTTDHFTPFVFVNPANPDNLYLTTDNANTTKNIFYPHVGMGTGTTYGVDDWTYATPKCTLYVVPTGTQGIVAANFRILYDATKATVVATAGNLFGGTAFYTSSPGSGQLLVQTSNLDAAINTVPGSNKYLAMLVFTITKPGYNSIGFDDLDFRYYDAGSDAQNSVYVTSYPGSIKFYLGDIAKFGSTSTGDGMVEFSDLSPFSGSYWSTNNVLDPLYTYYRAKYDIGPTSNSGYFSMPTPDGKIEFEDLVIFSIGYGKSAAGQLPKQSVQPITLATLAPSSQADGTTRVPITVSGAVTDVRALSLSMLYPSTMTFVGVEKAGEFDNDYSFMKSKAEGGKLTVDAAILGLEHNGVSGAGVVAYAVFNGKGTVRIEQVRARNSANNPIGVTIENSGTVPTVYSLSQNYPNPFNPTTSINYQLPKDAQVRIVIYNMLGEEVATLVNGMQSAGSYTATWNGKDGSGQTVSSGMYIYKMTAGDYTSIKKMVLMK